MTDRRSDQPPPVGDLGELVAQWEALCSITPDEVTADLIDRLASARWRIALYGVIGEDDVFVRGLERLAIQTRLRAHTDPAAAAALVGVLVRLRLLGFIVTEQNSRRTPLPIVVARALVGAPRTALWQTCNPSARASLDAVVMVIRALVRNDRLTSSLLRVAEDTVAYQNSTLMRDELLSKLAQAVAPRKAQLAWEMSQKVQHSAFRGEAQAAAAAALARDDLEGGRDAARSIDDPSLRCEALVAVACQAEDMHQAASFLWEAHEASEEVKDPFRRCESLLRIASGQSAQAGVDSLSMLSEVLESLSRIEEDGVRGEAIIAAAGCGAKTGMGAAFFERVLAAANGIADSGVRDEVIVALCKALPEEMHTLALRAAMSLEDEWRRGEAIGAVAGTVARQGAGGATEILALLSDGWVYDQALFTVVSNLPTSQREAQLEMTRAVTDRWYRCRALAMVAKTLIDEERQLRISILEDALDAASDIDGALRDEAFARLATDFLGSEPAWALSVARQVKDPLIKSEVLATAASQSYSDNPDLGRNLYWESLDTFWHSSLDFGERLEEVVVPLISTGGSAAELLGLISTLGDRWSLQGAVTRALSFLAERDFQAALRLATDLTPQLREEVFAERAKVIAKDDPITALAMVADSSSWRRSTVIKTALESLAASDPARAIAIWEEASQQDQEVSIAPLVRGLSVNDPDSAIDLAESVLIISNRRSYASEDLVMAVIALDPEMALKITQLITDPYSRVSTVIRVAELRCSDDPEWALRAIMDLELAEDRARGLERIALSIVPTDLDLALDWANRISETAARERLVGEIAVAAAGHEEGRSLRIAASLSDEQLKRETGLRIGSVAAERDPVRGLEIMETILTDEPGAADSGYISAMLKVDPERAVNYAFSLPDAWQRDLALKHIATQDTAEGGDAAWEIAQAIANRDLRLEVLIEVACSKDRPDLLCDIAFEQTNNMKLLLAFVCDALDRYEAASELSRSLSAEVIAALRECGIGLRERNVDRAVLRATSWVYFSPF
jgi:hypothetical protein